MSYQVLENNAIDITNVDGISMNNLSSGNRSGIVGGFLNECRISSAGNSVIMSTGCLLIRGIRIKVSDAISINMASPPVADTEYQLVAEIARATIDPHFEPNIYIQIPTTLIQNDIINAPGVFRLEIGKFTHKTDGSIANAKRTATILRDGPKGNKGDPSTIDKIGGSSVDIDLSDAQIGTFGTFKNPILVSTNSIVTFNNFEPEPETQRSFMLHIRRTVDVSVTWMNITAWVHNEIPILPVGKTQKVLVTTEDGIDYVGEGGGYI